VLDLYSRRLLACPISEHPDAVLAGDAIKIAAAVRGGRQAIEGVVFHSDHGSTYTARDFTHLCKEKLGIGSRWAASGRASTTPPPSRSSPPSNTRSCPDTRSPPRPTHATIVLAWCHEFYNTRRRHSSAALLPPVEFEKIIADQPAAA
jgi:transposase InsO family protein